MMTTAHTFEPAARVPAGAGPPTRPERIALLRALLLGRGLERVLPGLGVGSREPADPNGVLTAISAASGLDPDDRLITAHGFLCAHLAAGAELATVARLRLRLPVPPGERPIGGVGPQSPAALALGVAFALRRAPTRRCAVALVERRWAEAEECRAALALAREQKLPLVVVAIDSATVVDHAAPAVDRHDFEAVRAAVRSSIAAAHSDNGASLVVASRLAKPDADRPSRPLFRAPVDDPLVDYERRLLINGFSRTDLAAVHRDAARELEETLAGGLARSREAR